MLPIPVTREGWKVGKWRGDKRFSQAATCNRFFNAEGTEGAEKMRNDGEDD